MVDHTCECGHINPQGTTLCEVCGRPVHLAADEVTADNFPNMRYEGRAIRSMTRNRTLTDYIWRYLSSVKVGVGILVFLLFACVVGTIFPQEQYIPLPPDYSEQEVAAYYEGAYGVLGKIYYTLGLHNTFDSWWFRSAMVLLAASLLAASIDRGIPLYKALKKPRINPHLSFLSGQKVYGVSAESVGSERERLLQAAAESLKKHGYRVYREGDSLLGEKGRFSRWGPYVIHLGIILFLVVAMFRDLPSLYLNEYVWVKEGETVWVEGTDYYIQNLDYKTEYYQQDEFAEDLKLGEKVIPKNFQTDLVLYQREGSGPAGSNNPKLVKLKSGTTVVNKPFVYEDLYIYQSGNQEMLLKALNFQVIRRGIPVGSLKVDLYEMEPLLKVGNEITVKVLDYFPDFYLKDGKPATKSNSPNNPMLALEISAADGKKERLVYLQGTVISNEQEPEFGLQVEMPDFMDMSGLLVRKDVLLPYIYLSAAIGMAGLIMWAYWQHRRIWVRLEENQLHVAAHTNKNWFGLQKDFMEVTKQLQIPIVMKNMPQGKSS